MVALAESIDTRPRLDQFERAALRRELSRWGAWQDKQAANTGFPSSDNVQRFVGGRGGGLGGHRILMLEMPAEVWTTNYRVLSLPERLQAAVRAAFVGIMLEDDSLLAWEDRARRIGVDGRELSALCTRAMTRIAGL